MTPKHQALFAGTGRKLTPSEQKAKAKLLFGGAPKMKVLSEKEKTDYQKKTGRGYNE